MIHDPTARPNPTDRPRRPHRHRHRSFAGPSLHPQPPANLLMENVKILKRGEPLPPFLPKRSHPRTSPPTRSAGGDHLSLGSTNRLGPDPKTVKKELPVAIPGKAYATGVMSPHPSLVPVPGFLSGAARGGAEIATHGLRRLLGIGLA
ncbi:hypothetical protein MLD38_014863 [Melastoma candidum]|uniref:Uncharacterized protein n=1 Tax=Melastoma candidum TaxID=119954 RepID=A0ACB9RFJ3_9MYRT|nr:hypothetical protein MLD38_014863 [Melastoma candidum]